MPRSFRAGLLAAAACLGLAACEANQMYVGYETILGVNAQVDMQRQAGHLVIGYDRDFAALVPKSVQVPAAELAALGLGPESQEWKDVMALLVCNEVVIEGIDLKTYTESIASGLAAIQFAEAVTAQEGDISRFFKCYEPGQAPSPPASPQQSAAVRGSAR